MLIIDTNDNVAGHIDFLNAKGVKVIGRYYSTDASKRLTGPEAVAILSAGLTI